MVASIPASAIVNVYPNVIAAGGTGLDLCGLFLTRTERVPIGSVQAFTSAAAVATYFGGSSPEATFASTYFLGFSGSLQTPAKLLIGTYSVAAVAAYLRGGRVAGMTLATLQGLSGTLTIDIDGVHVVSGAIDLSTANSFTAAAALIQTAFAFVGGETVTYDAIAGAFVIHGGLVGSAGAVAYPVTNALATSLELTSAAGAVISNGSDLLTPAGIMDAVSGYTQDFATFGTIYEATHDDKVAFAAWNSGQLNRFGYIMGDSDAAAAASNGSASAMGAIIAASYSGTIPAYDPVNPLALVAFTAGAIASIDFSAPDGRTNLAFRQQAGLVPGVTDRTIGDNLTANGYNFYGAYATANERFTFLYPGQVSGPFAWIDSFIDQIWLSNAFQLALMQLLVNFKSIPYNAQGNALIAQALAGPINDALAFGAIRSGVTLSPLQAAEVNALAGLAVDKTIAQRGWYVAVLPASPQVRAARGSPPIIVFYTDGQSVQKINLNSLQVQ